MATFLREKRVIRSGIPFPGEQGGHTDMDGPELTSGDGGGDVPHVRMWVDPRDRDSDDSDSNMPADGVISEKTGYLLRRTRCGVVVQL